MNQETTSVLRTFLKSQVPEIEYLVCAYARRDLPWYLDIPVELQDKHTAGMAMDTMRGWVFVRFGPRTVGCYTEDGHCLGYRMLEYEIDGMRVVGDDLLCSLVDARGPGMTKLNISRWPTTLGVSREFVSYPVACDFLVLADGRVVVEDIAKKKVQVLNQCGSVQVEWPSPGEYFDVVAFDGIGVVVRERQNDTLHQIYQRLRVCGPTSSRLGEWMPTETCGLAFGFDDATRSVLVRCVDRAIVWSIDETSPPLRSFLLPPCLIDSDLAVGRRIDGTRVLYQLSRRRLECFLLPSF